jgi:hypothetical protein
MDVGGATCVDLSCNFPASIGIADQKQPIVATALGS